MIDDDLRARFESLADRAVAPSDPVPLVRGRAVRLRRRRAATSVTAVACLAVVLLPLLLHAGRTTPAAARPADGVVTRACDRTAFALAARLGPIQAVYGVRLSAGAASRWIDPRTYRPDPVLVALPPADEVSFCLVVGDLDALTEPDPAPPSTNPARFGDAHVALVTVIDGRASARYIGGPDYSRLPAEPAPGIRRSVVAPYVVLDGSTVASSAPSAVAAVPRCRAGQLSSRFAYDGDVDGSPQWSVTVHNAGATSCSLFGELALTALDRAGSALPAPDAGLDRTRVSGVLPAGGAQALRVTIYGDPSPNLCSREAVLTPARLVLTVADVTLTVTNRATTAAPGRSAVAGCPGRIYAGSAEIG